MAKRRRSPTCASCLRWRMRAASRSISRLIPSSYGSKPRAINCRRSRSPRPRANPKPNDSTMKDETRYTAEFVERGYNNRAAVPDHPRFMALYAEMSRAAVATLGPQLDLRYGPGAKETLDLFVPAARPRGTFVFIHGGYWRTFDKADFL